MVATPQSLHEFVNYRQQYITGRERSQAQVFLDRFFQAFGHQGALQAGAEYEVAIAKGSNKGKTGFADLVWKPRVLIEMKKQGEDLGKHYRQAFNYWTRLVPERPKYVILCNFDEFWIYNFDNQLDDPVDIVKLKDLPERAGAFGFMELSEKTPIFRNNQVEITEKAARKMGELCEILKQRGEKQGFGIAAAQRLVLQCVLAMFAEDRRMLPPDMFINCIQDCLGGRSSYDVLGGLFQEMNRPGISPAGKYKGVDYFNGGLFATIHPIELTKEELNYLDSAAREDWQQIRPSIFGNIFEGTIGKKRTSFDTTIHFTSEADIMKIVKPTISNFWEAKIEAANSISELNSLQLELQNYRVLDPACGSGNFLYLAYQELKEIEKSLLVKISSRRRSETDKQQIQMGLVTPLQFYGMDINSFAVELAKVTMTIAKKVAIDNLKLTERELPLDTLDNNIVCQDALFTEWVKADAIIGNPPFLGSKNMRKELRNEYVDKVFQKYPDVKDADYCSSWFRLAQDNINQTGRVGLVGTNSISQGKSRKAILDYITNKGGHIHEAISTQPWSGEAKVHVSIVNWSLEQPEQYFLDDRKVSFINSSLNSDTDVSKAIPIQANKNKSFQGVIPNGQGFIVTEEEAESWIIDEHKNKEVLKPFSMGTNLAQNPFGKPDRWIIDFDNMNIEDASEYKIPFTRVKSTIPIERQNNSNLNLIKFWWKYEGKRIGMRKAILPLSYYFAVPRVSKWSVFIPISSNWLCGDLNVVVASEDYYVLGILTSNIHRCWLTKGNKSTLKSDIRYNKTIHFETFPFPQNPGVGASRNGGSQGRGGSRNAPTGKIVEQIRNKTIDLHQYRIEQMERKQWGITQLYNAYFHEPASKLYQLHQQLDALVMQAYNFKADDDILAKLLELNSELAAKEKRGEKVIGAESPYENEMLEDIRNTLIELQDFQEELPEFIEMAEKQNEVIIND